MERGEGDGESGGRWREERKREVGEGDGESRGVILKVKSMQNIFNYCI